nr:UvrD-helicase domain-containing protein [Candidatus Microthrix sp.]
MSAPLLDGLNPAQREAVMHGEGPLLVVAGAGSGKTRVLTHRIARLIEDDNVSPFEILAITFTNKAADEMRHRVGSLVGPVAQKMWVSTFHSACVRILRRDGQPPGLPQLVHHLRPGRRHPACGVRVARPQHRHQATSGPLGAGPDLVGQERTAQSRAVGR